MINTPQQLKTLLGNRVLFDEPMCKYTSFRTGGKADVLAFVKDKEEFSALKLYAHNNGLPIYLMGNGTNILVKDNGISGIVINLSKIKKISTKDNTVTALCGNSMSETSNYAAKTGLAGTEFMSGIPGSIGGGIYMNAGAYGGEMKDIVISVTALDKNGDDRIYSSSELDFSYRHSIFCKNDETVYSATFLLSPDSPEEITARIRDLNKRRKEKQPLEYPSAGSTFKRPEGYYAAELIDKAGLKGYRIGGAMVSEKHAGFIINRDNASSGDILNLINYVSQKVFDEFNVKLEPEVKIVGRD